VALLCTDKAASENDVMMKAFGVLLLLQVGEEHFGTELWLHHELLLPVCLHTSWAHDQHTGAMMVHVYALVLGATNSSCYRTEVIHQKPNCSKLYGATHGW
jgi:hypothetical protein